MIEFKQRAILLPRGKIIQQHRNTIKISRRGAKPVGTKSSQDAAAVSGPRAYKMGGRILLFQTPVERLSEFALVDDHATGSHLFADLPNLVLLDNDPANIHYQGEAPFADQLQQVDCWRSGQRMQIDVSGNPVCLLDFRDRHIHVLNDRSFDDDLVLEVVTGPAMISLLATEGIFCLHAGAVSTPEGTIALIAESGVGKSTLSQHQGGHWEQLADDILALEHLALEQKKPGTTFHQNSNNNSVESFQVHDFPQLKLPDCRAESRADAQTRIDMVVRLSGSVRDEISIQPLSPAEAMLQIVRHTVAARLFDKNTLAAHARFAQALSANIPVVELSYPRSMQRLDQVREALLSYLRKLKPDATST